MSAADKIKNAAQQVGGKVEEAAGRSSGDASLEAEGKGDQAAGDLKQRGEHLKDAVKG